jgi:transcriptional regulator with XRE-family HTH domain
MEEAQLRDLSARIKRLRKARGWSAERLAHEANMSSKTVSRLEKGQTAEPHDDTFQKLAIALGVTIEEVAGPRDEPEVGNGPIERLERIERKLDALVSALLSPDAAAELERELDDALRQAETPSASTAASERKPRRSGKAH